MPALFLFTVVLAMKLMLHPDFIIIMIISNNQKFPYILLAFNWFLDA